MAGPLIFFRPRRGNGGGASVSSADVTELGSPRHRPRLTLVSPPLRKPRATPPSAGRILPRTPGRRNGAATTAPRAKTQGEVPAPPVAASAPPPSAAEAPRAATSAAPGAAASAAVAEKRKNRHSLSLPKSAQEDIARQVEPHQPPAAGRAVPPSSSGGGAAGGAAAGGGPAGPGAGAPAGAAGPHRGLPQVGNPPSALRELPALRDAPPNKREDLFRLKLQLCGVIFSFDDPTSDKRGKVRPTSPPPFAFFSPRPDPRRSFGAIRPGTRARERAANLPSPLFAPPSIDGTNIRT